MNSWNQTLFEELISDNRFLFWASGNNLSDQEYWITWAKDHPQYCSEFEKAVQVAKNLNFKGIQFTNYEVLYSWAKISDKVKTRQIRQANLWVLKIAAILLLPVIFASGWLLYQHNSITTNYLELLRDRQNQKLTVVAPFCARTIVDLPDGSKVWLNCGSEITYPIVFNPNERRVHLTGEAYFKVKKDNVPFFVNSLGPEIKVYGTEFNVNSYTNEDFVTVALSEGNISLNKDGKEEFILPGQISIFDKNNKSITVKNTDVTAYSSWREGKYIFRNTSLSAILRILQRQYSVTISLLDPKVGFYRYNATINNESLEQILQLLSISAPIKYIYKRKELKPDGTYVPDHVIISADETRIIKN
jgi:transmembrane sensor